MLSSANIIQEEDFLNINFGQALRRGGVCVCVCVCAYVSVYAHVCEYVYLCVCECMHTYLPISVYRYRKSNFVLIMLPLQFGKIDASHFLKVCSFSVAEMRFQPCSLALQPTVIIISFPPSSHLFFHSLSSPTEVAYAH